MSVRGLPLQPPVSGKRAGEAEDRREERGWEVLKEEERANSRDLFAPSRSGRRVVFSRPFVLLHLGVRGGSSLAVQQVASVGCGAEAFLIFPRSSRHKRGKKTQEEDGPPTVPQLSSDSNRRPQRSVWIASGLSHAPQPHREKRDTSVSSTLSCSPSSSSSLRPETSGEEMEASHAVDGRESTHTPTTERLFRKKTFPDHASLEHEGKDLSLYSFLAAVCYYVEEVYIHSVVRPVRLSIRERREKLFYAAGVWRVRSFHLASDTLLSWPLQGREVLQWMSWST